MFLAQQILARPAQSFSLSILFLFLPAAQNPIGGALLFPFLRPSPSRPPPPASHLQAGPAWGGRFPRIDRPTAESGRHTPRAAPFFLARTPRPGPRPYIISAVPPLGTLLQPALPPFAPNPSSRAAIVGARSSTPRRRFAALPRRVRRPGAPRGREDARRPIRSPYPSLSHPCGLARIRALPLAVTSSLWPPMLRANPTVGFATTPSSSQAQPRSVSCSDGRFRPTPAERRRPCLAIGV